MNAQDLTNELKSILAKKGYTLTALVGKLNEQGITTTLQNISNKLKRGSINYLEMVNILNAVGYEIEWKEKTNNDK